MSDIDNKTYSDFHYLLGLMRPMHDVPEFAWLPELFSIIGTDKLLLLCKYAGGETIQIPTISQLSASIEALEWFYDVKIRKAKSITDVPVDLHPLFRKVLEVYDAREYQEKDI